jgi:hypothetical protein
VQSSACSELLRVALACANEAGGSPLLLQTSAWVLADLQRLTVPALGSLSLLNSLISRMLQACQQMPLLPLSAVFADISIRSKAEVPLWSLHD